MGDQWSILILREFFLEGQGIFNFGGRESRRFFDEQSDMHPTLGRTERALQMQLARVIGVPKVGLDIER